ncbi:MAG: hypothetical protein GKR93_09195 [Gammaproteobacteria bacterium]|nr:hypothetical protein [Gammaproteobacteria bacterium]
MKTLPTLLFCLVLSLTVAGQSYAMQQVSSPQNGINQVLQMKIEKDLTQLLNSKKAYRGVKKINTPVRKEPATVQESDEIIAPDCLCDLHTRII